MGDPVVLGGPSTCVCQIVGVSMPGLPDVQGEVRGGAPNPPSHLEGLLGSLDGFKGGGTGVTSPAVARTCTWGGNGLGGKGSEQSLWKLERGGDRKMLR